MATIGNIPTTPDMDYSQALDGSVYGLKITMGEDASGGLSIWFYGITQAASSVQAAIYVDGVNPALITEATVAYAPGVLTEQWHEIVLNTVALNDATIYRLVLFDSGAVARVAHGNGGIYNVYDRDDYNNAWSGTVWDDPATGFPQGVDAGTRDITMYLEYTAAGSTATITGTITDATVEADIVTGGKTIILTLTNDTWAAAGTGPIGSTADTQAIIDGITSAQSETLGWNNEVRDNEVTTAVVRTSDTVATITVTAAASYDITAQETITATIPAAVLVTSATPVVASPTFTVDVTVPTIATIDSPVLDAETGNVITTTNYTGDITSLTIQDVQTAGAHEIDVSTSLAGTAGSFTFDMPDVSILTIDTLGIPFDSSYWTHTATAVYSAESDTEVIIVNPQTGWARVDLAESMNMAVGSVTNGWLGLQVDVTGATVANPSVLAATAHGFTNLQEVTLSGFTTTPDINGVQTITVIDPNSFSVPVNVTVVTVGTGTALSGATSEHGQFYYPTANNTSIAADGTLLTDSDYSFFSYFFDTTNSNWKRFEVRIAVLPVTVNVGPSATPPWYNHYPSTPYYDGSYPNTARSSWSYTHRVDPVNGNDSYTYADVTSDPDTFSWATVYRALRGAPAGSADNTSEAVTAGDTLRVDDGIHTIPDTVTRTTWNACWEPVNTGTLGNPITIRAETDGGVEIRFNDTLDVGASFGVGAGTVRHYITFRGLTVDCQYAPSQSDTGPVIIGGTDGDEATGNIVENCTLIGQILNPSRSDNYNGIRLEYTNSTIIRNNHIEKFIDPSTVDSGVRPGSHNSTGVTVYDSHNFTINNNYIKDCGTGIFIKGGYGQENCGYDIYRNILEDCHTAGISNVNVLNTCNVDTYSNKIYQNLINQVTYSAGAAFGGSWDYEGIAFVNNTVIGTTWGAYFRNVEVTPISITRSGTTATVTHTAHGYDTGQAHTVAYADQTEYNGSFIITVVDVDTYTYQVSGSPATPATGPVSDILGGDGDNNFETNTILMQNNIFYDLSTGGVSLGNSASDDPFTMFEILQDRNCWNTIANTWPGGWWYDNTNYTTLTAWEAAYFADTGLHLEQNVEESDPLFTNTGLGDYTLQSTSPCKPANGGAAQDILQLLGGSNTAPIDMGCYVAAAVIGIDPNS